MKKEPEHEYGIRVGSAVLMFESQVAADDYARYHSEKADKAHTYEVVRVETIVTYKKD